MSKKSELIKNTIILTVGKICTQFVSFLLLPLYTALLEPGQYGAVDLFNTYCTLLLPIFNWQFDNGLFRFLLDARDDKNYQKSILTTVMNTNFFQSMLYILFYILMRNYITLTYKMYLALDVLFSIFLCSLLQFARGIGSTAKYTVASFISATSMVVMNVVLIVFCHMGAEGMFISSVLSKFITIIYLAISLRVDRYYIWYHFSKKVFKEIFVYSVPLIPNQLSWWVVGASDRMIISHILGIAANGVYSVANKFSGLFITFYNIFNLSWTESVSLHINDLDGEDFLKDTINSMFKLFSSACFGLISIMPFLFPIMVNQQYELAYQQIPILMIAVLFQVLVGLYSVIYVALKKSGEIARTSFYAAAINLVINILFIKSWGLFAASFSTFTAYLVMGIYRYFHVKQYVNIPIQKRCVVWTMAIGCVSVVSYYSGNIVVNTVGLAVVCIYSVVVNWSFLRFIFKMVRNFRHN